MAFLRHFVCVLLSILVGVFAMRVFCVAENCECVWCERLISFVFSVGNYSLWCFGFTCCLCY